MGKFKETGGNIGEDVWSVIPATSFRPTSQTVIRLNYRYLKQRDIFSNPPSIHDVLIWEFQHTSKNKILFSILSIKVCESHFHRGTKIAIISYNKH